MKKIISLSLLIIISLVLFTGCKDTKTYNVLIKDNNSPYSNFEDNKAKGLEVDLLDAISKEENFTINYVKDSEKDDYISASSELINENGNYDSTDSYYQKGIIFSTKDDSNINSYEQLLHQKIGVIKGSYGEDFANQIAPQYNLSVKEYTTEKEMYSDCKNNKIAGFFDDTLSVKSAIKKGEKFKTFENEEKTDSLSLMVNKGEEKEFVKAFNSGLKKIMSNGEYEKIVNKYK